MNVFGAFTFGSLIKTFIPGFVWVVAFAVLWRDLHAFYPQTFAAPPSLAGEEQNALVLAIPAAILFGLVSNIVVFMGVNDWLVRRPSVIESRNCSGCSMAYAGRCATLTGIGCSVRKPRSRTAS